MSGATSVPIDPLRCVVIPSYNSGPQLEQTVREVMAVWQPVIVVVDGSTDGSNVPVVHLAAKEPGLHSLAQAGNTGKGAAVFAAFNYAADLGLTHAVVFDSDGQHDPADLPSLMDAAKEHPLALVMGMPGFGEDAPACHVLGHALADFFARVEALRPELGDSLFGLRVYPIFATIKAMQHLRGARRFDFDTQMAVRLPWLGVPTLKLPARVRYPADRPRHFHYLRDNLLLVRVHAWLLLQGMFLWPKLVWRKLSHTPPFDAAKYHG